LGSSIWDFYFSENVEGCVRYYSENINNFQCQNGNAVTLKFDFFKNFSRFFTIFDLLDMKKGDDLGPLNIF
jgi:hypothetical protein